MPEDVLPLRRDRLATTFRGQPTASRRRALPLSKCCRKSAA